MDKNDFITIINITMAKIRDYIKLILSLFFIFLYLPHILIVIINRGGVKEYVMSDVSRMMTREYIKVNDWLGLIFLLHTNSYFRTLFYYRIGPVKALLIRWYRPGNKYFTMSYKTKIGKGMLIAHPYATIINAESIGENFSCIQCTTLGASKGARPVIGDNVSCGANVIIIGPVRVGNNVTIGAGSVVVKDLPDNCVAVGNPARVVK